MIVQRTRGILLALSLGLLAACSDSGSDKPAQGASAPAAGGDTLAAAKAAGKIRIGYANEAPFAFMAVSYTHLDVYKRQPLWWCLYPFRNGENNARHFYCNAACADLR